jgi:hypothetical protein
VRLASCRSLPLPVPSLSLPAPGSGDTLLTTNSGRLLPLLTARRMNAVRIRKENQVLNAEEKRAMSTYSYEEKVGREADLMNQFKTIIKSKGLGDA